MTSTTVSRGVVPPFCVLAWADQDVQPHAHSEIDNVGENRAIGCSGIQGNPDVGKHLAGQLLEADFDTGYSTNGRRIYPSPLDCQSVIVLDYERKGLPYPVVGRDFNCYGSSLPAARALFAAGPFDASELNDPPSPRPQRCMALGDAMVKAFMQSSRRVAIVASSSWSHAFCTTSPTT